MIALRKDYYLLGEARTEIITRVRMNCEGIFPLTFLTNLSYLVYSLFLECVFLELLYF